MKAPASSVLGILALILALSPNALGQGTSDDRSAAMSQLVKETTVSVRSSASLDQISSVAADARGAVEQIDPSARAVPEATRSVREGQDDFLVADALSGENSSQTCVISPDQAAIVQSLRMQGQIVADECEIIEWLAVSGQGRTVSDTRRREEEAVIVMMPGLLAADAAADSGSEARDKEPLREEVRDLIVLPGQVSDLSGNQ